jgi:G3E family GTPase
MSNNEQTKHQHHDTIKLTLEDDSVMECKVLTVFDCNGKEYLALVPEHPETEGDVFLYGFREHRENEIELINIDDKQELNDVINAFEKWCDEQEASLIPVDIYSGFLGAGKTTLIKKMIAEAYAGEKVVLIENEFGEISIDGGFLREAGVEITEMNSGCICCSLVGDFGESLRKVVADYSPDRIIIEPSGVGKLSDVIKAVEGVAEDTPIALNSYVAVVDVKKYAKYIKLFGEFFIDQIQSAGLVVLSRTKDIDEDELEKCTDALNEINPNSLIITTDWEEINGKQILDVMESGFDLLYEDEYIEGIGYEDECCCGHHHEDEHGHHHHDHDEECCCGHHHEDEHGHHHHDHDEECCCGHHHEYGHGHHHADEVFTSWGTETVRRFTEDEMKNILAGLSDSEKYGTVLRAKGIVQSADGRWIHFDYVPDEYEVRFGSADVTGRIVVIGTGLAEAELEKTFKK